MKTKHIISILALCLLPALAVDVHAVPRMWREACGKVSSVNAKLTRLDLVRANDGRKLTITWNSRTAFYRNGVRVKLPSFVKGQKVCLHYRSPLFGERWATQVSWEEASADPASRTRANK